MAITMKYINDRVTLLGVLGLIIAGGEDDLKVIYPSKPLRLDRV